jgi:hypothetical protein
MDTAADCRALSAARRAPAQPPLRGVCVAQLVALPAASLRLWCGFIEEFALLLQYSGMFCFRVHCDTHLYVVIALFYSPVATFVDDRGA